MAETELKVKSPKEVEVKTEGKIKLDLGFLAEMVVRLMKRDISERYKETMEVTDEDWKFCEKIDWHPVDELPLKEEFVKKLEEIKKGPHSKAMTLEELDKWFDEL